MSTGSVNQGIDLAILQMRECMEIMTGKSRILTALDSREPDRVPLYIHGINEAPIIGIGKHRTGGLPQRKDFYEMDDAEKAKLVDRAHEHGLKVVRHGDGNLWSIMDTLLDTGYDGLNPLEPQADMQLKKVKQYCGERICLLGNIDCVELLPDGNPSQIDAAVRKANTDAAAGGGCILCSSNSLHPGVNPENCIAMFEATKKYGAYLKAI
jgi:uroporphyrinogen-III decarboxylase